MRLLQAVKVRGVAEGDRDLVSPGVPLADGAGAVVHLVTDVVEGEVLRELGHQGSEVRVVRERKDGALEGRDNGRDAVLKDGVHNPPDTELGLNNTGGDLLDVERLLVLLDGHHVLAQGDILPIALEVGLTSGKVSLELANLV